VIARVFRHPTLIAEQAIGYALLGAAFYWWLGFPESGIFALLLSLAAIALIAAGAVLLARHARACFPATASGSCVDGIVSLLLLLAALAAAYFLVWWIPGIESFRGQAASMAVRWGIAYLLVVIAWLNLLAASK
jgi:hypothetical protein